MNCRPLLSRRSRLPVWRSNAAGLAVLGLLLQLVLGQAAMLRMASPAADAGMICAPDHAGKPAPERGAPHPVHHHADCPLCAGFAPALGPAASTPIPATTGREIRVAFTVVRQAVGRPAPAYNPRAPPSA